MCAQFRTLPTRLKRLIADQALDILILKEAARPN
jgi:hypothetical protein